MAQSIIIMAFRKRLKGRGYTDISIRRHKVASEWEGHPVYLVQAREPLAGQNVVMECSEVDLDDKMR